MLNIISSKRYPFNRKDLELSGNNNFKRNSNLYMFTTLAINEDK